jgi:hypothetical protein
MTAEAPVSIGGKDTGGLIITGLANTSYTVWVKASNTAGDSAYARREGTPQQQASSKPDTPAIIEVTPGNKKLTVTWTAQARASSYKVYYNTGCTFSSTAPSVDAAPFFGRVKQEIILPANSTTYYVWVTASNSRGESTESLSASSKPDAPAPINFNNVSFKLGTAQAEYIFSEVNPPGPFVASGTLWDRLTRRKETALGNLFCDGSAWYMRTVRGETFDFVFLNGGLLDQPLSRGTITVGSIESIPPPSSRDDFYTLITLRGPELKLLLDQAALIRNPGHGSDDHAAGLFSGPSQSDCGHRGLYFGVGGNREYLRHALRDKTVFPDGGTGFYPFGGSEVLGEMPLNEA